jgi:hypothetical protein
VQSSRDPTDTSRCRVTLASVQCVSSKGVLRSAIPGKSEYASRLPAMRPTPARSATLLNWLVGVLLRRHLPEYLST